MALGQINPIDYTTGAIDPVQHLLAGIAGGLGVQGSQQQLAMNRSAEARAAELHPLAVQGAQQAQDIAAAQEARNADAYSRQVQAQEEAAARQAAFREGMGNLVTLGTGATYQDYAALAAQFPEFGEAIGETWSTLDEGRQRGTAEVLGQIAVAMQNGATDRAIEIAEQYADAAENSGDPQAAATARAMVELAKINPDAALASIGVTLAQISPDVAEQVFDGGAGNRVQSTQMVAGRISVQTMSDGTVRVVDTATNEVLSGEAARAAIAAAEEAEAAAAQAVSEGRRTGTLTADIEIGGEAAASVKAAEQAQDVAMDTFAALGSIQGNIANLDRAVAALDAGARTGQIESRVPSWNAATLELRNIRNQLGLDVVGSVTFGALSAGELALALETAIPQNMQEDDLRDWLLRKKEAQQKLYAYLEEQAVFLSQPGNTVADWLAYVRENRMSPTGATPPQAAPVAPQPAAPAVAPPAQVTPQSPPVQAAPQQPSTPSYLR